MVNLHLCVCVLGDAVGRSRGTAGGPIVRRLPVYSFIFLRDDKQPALIRYDFFFSGFSFIPILETCF